MPCRRKHLIFILGVLCAEIVHGLENMCLIQYATVFCFKVLYSIRLYLYLLMQYLVHLMFLTLLLSPLSGSLLLMLLKLKALAHVANTVERPTTMSPTADARTFTHCLPHTGSFWLARLSTSFRL